MPVIVPFLLKRLTRQDGSKPQQRNSQTASAADSGTCATRLNPLVRRHPTHDHCVLLDVTTSNQTRSERGAGLNTDECGSSANSDVRVAVYTGQPHPSLLSLIRTH